MLYSDASRRSIKLCDFGFAVICGDKKLKTICGSPAYMAPELSTREAYLGPPVDLWALGCFAFEVLHGVAPFRGESLATLQLRIKRVDHHPFRPSLTTETKKLIKALLVAESRGRCPAATAADGWRALHSQLPGGGEGSAMPLIVDRDGRGFAAAAPAAAPSAE